MKFAKEKLNLENGIEKEWIITNGIGGYSSSTIIGANTRKYHGLLISSLIPPAKRVMILSKLDESIEIEGRKYNLFSNVGKTYISKGFTYLESFEKKYFPIFTYKVEGIEIEKTICMEYGKNIVIVKYSIRNNSKDAKLTLAPIMNYRDIHSNNSNYIFDVEQDVNDNNILLNIDKSPNIYMSISEGNYIKHNSDIFKDMFYIEEEKRGFNPVENHVVPGRYEVQINANENKDIYFSCSLDNFTNSKMCKKIISNEIKRIDEIISNSHLLSEEVLLDNELEKKRKELLENLIISSDNFVVKNSVNNTVSMIAGYPWFLDWMRDTLISFEGIFLIPKRFDMAKKILEFAIKDINCGLVPNTYGEEDHKPLYNSVDSSLLLFEQVEKYLKYTNDYKFVSEKMYDVLSNIIENYANGIDLDDNNIYMDTDGLIVSGTEFTQNTWMDAKFAGVAVTPRNGKPVEINALWYNALKIMEELSNKFNESENEEKYKKLANKCKKSFKTGFYNAKRKSLDDVIGDSKIRPNQLFALSLTYPVLNPKNTESKEIFDTVTKKLYNEYGLKSLAKGERDYVDVYEGDSARRDFSYHQGITWTWLLGLYYNSLKVLLDESKTQKDKLKYQKEFDEFVEKTINTFYKECNERGCIGSISEIYDSKRPNLPKGAFSQAWSVAEIIRIISKS